MIRAVVIAAIFVLGGTSLAAKTPRVVAVSGPLAYFAMAIAGDQADVVYPVPADEDPMLWRPSIAEIAQIQSADLILLNGAGFAGWTTKSSLPRARTILTSRALEGSFIEAATAVTHSHGDEGAHSHSGAVPQIWLDFAQASVQAEAVATGLKRALRGAEGLEDGLSELQAELAALDERAKSVSASLSDHRIIASGPGLAYFARAYGLDLHELSWVPGATLDPSSLAAAQAGGTTSAVLWLATPDADSLAVVGDLPQARFDTGADAATDFVAQMEANLDALEALSGG